MSQSCPQWRGDIGAYIVGALDGTARDRLTRHLAACFGCMADFEELIPARDWLAMASATAMPEPRPASEPGRPGHKPPSEGLLTAGFDDALEPGSRRESATPLLARQREERRAPRRRARRWLAAAGAALAAAAAAVAVLASSGASSPTYHAVDNATGVSARAQLHGTPAGTQIDLTASGLPGSERCILVAVNHGRAEIAGSWHVTYDGWAHVVGTTGFPASRLTFLRIESVTGNLLLSIRL